MEKPSKKNKKKKFSIPDQASPTDTSNWDNRIFKTPGRRLVIETDQSNNKNVVSE
jgi:hypothetical protein